MKTSVLLVVVVFLLLCVPVAAYCPGFNPYDHWLIGELRQWQNGAATGQHQGNLILGGFAAAEILHEIGPLLIIQGRAALEAGNLDEYGQLRERFRVRLGVALTNTAEEALCYP